MHNKIYKIAMVSFASFGLTACGLSTIVSDGIDINGGLVGSPKAVSTHSYLDIDLKANFTQFKKTAVEHSITSDDMHTFKRGVNLYTIGTLNIVYDGNGGEKWSQNTSAEFGSQVGKTLVIENKSDQLLNDKFNYKTDDVNLWYITNSRYKVDSNGNKDFLSFETGFADFGQRTADMPKSGSKLYSGGYVAYELQRGTQTYAELVGKATFATDFTVGEPKISGTIEDIKRYKTLAGETRPKLIIYNGKITDGEFNAKIKYDDANLPNQIGGIVNGGFYGENANEIAGTGQFASQSVQTVFGFTGN